MLAVEPWSEGRDLAGFRVDDLGGLVCCAVAAVRGDWWIA
tara:strand:+ start:1789 stop:1908 length:120 start_codon:yes stop_codon:yes gene_type:complete